MNTIRPQAELLIVDSIHNKCTQIVAAKENQLPDGADVRFLSHQMAVIYESGIQALAYNNGDIEAAVRIDIRDIQVVLIHIADLLWSRDLIPITVLTGHFDLLAV